jgi:hypothetical protein
MVVVNQMPKKLSLVYVYIWVFFFVLLAPPSGFDVDILYTFTFFGVVFSIIYKLSNQISEIFIHEQFRLSQVVLHKRIGVYWLFNAANVWCLNRVVLVKLTLHELMVVFRLLELQAGSIEQFFHNIIHFVMFDVLIVGHLGGLRQIWTRFVDATQLQSDRVYQLLLVYLKRLLVIHFLTTVSKVVVKLN